MTLYEITNLIDGNGYVGITKRRIGARWSAHRKSLEKGKHYNIKLQEAYNRVGPKGLEYKIRETFDSIKDLEDAEKRILKEEKYRLYNVKKGGYDAPPVKHTEEIKKKIGEAAKKPVIGMSIQTGEIREYLCGKDTQLDGFNHKNIGKCCSLSVSTASGRVQKAISTGGWVWMRKSEYDIDEMHRRRKMAIRRGNNDQSRAIIGKSLIDGSIINFRSCTEAARVLKRNSTHIREACLDLTVRSAGQHVWVFADEHEPTILLDKRYAYAMDTFNGHRVIGPRSKRASSKKV